MLFPDCTNASSVQYLDLIPVSCFERPEHSYVTGLELMRGVRWETTKDDVVCETELQDFESLMASEPITD
jgi:hypothetical protein